MSCSILTAVKKASADRCHLTIAGSKVQLLEHSVKISEYYVEYRTATIKTKTEITISTINLNSSS